MIYMATLFKGLISIETLGQLPLQFVHRLRDMREKQRSEEMERTQAASKMNGMPAITPSMAEDIMDELT